MYFRTFRMFFIAASRFFFKIMQTVFPVWVSHISHILFRVVDRSVTAFCSFGKNQHAKHRSISTNFSLDLWLGMEFAVRDPQGWKMGNASFPIDPSEVTASQGTHLSVACKNSLWRKGVGFSDDGRFCKVSQRARWHSSSQFKGMKRSMKTKT